VHMKKGAGVFVRTAGATTLRDARDLNEFIRVALDQAARNGFRGPEIRAAVERWLRAVPPERAVTVDPSLAMAQLLKAEIAPTLGLPVTACSLAEVQREPGLLSGVLTVALPYHVEQIHLAVPAATIEVVNLEVPPAERAAILGAAAGSTLLVVSHSETVLPFASTLVGSLRGEEVLVEARALSDARGWRRLLPAADLVFADVIAAPLVRRSRPRRLREFRIVGEAGQLRLQAAARADVPLPARVPSS
jgi:hypothetical protein